MTSHQAWLHLFAATLAGIATGTKGGDAEDADGLVRWAAQIADCALEEFESRLSDEEIENVLAGKRRPS